MDMNKIFVLKKEQAKPSWHVVDAEGKVLGRLATEIADKLRGKDKPYYTPHTDSGDYVVVINADKVVLTGNKWDGKIYDRYTGWMGGYKVTTAKDLMKRHPTDLVFLAVRGMLPKNKLNRQVIEKLKIYVGNKHPHAAQINTTLINSTK